jgi:hypothetical protein
VSGERGRWFLVGVEAAGRISEQFFREIVVVKAPLGGVSVTNLQSANRFSAALR